MLPVWESRAGTKVKVPTGTVSDVRHIRRGVRMETARSTLPLLNGLGHNLALIQENETR